MPDDSTIEEAGEESGGNSGSLFSPEGIMMLLISGFLDLVGLVLLCFALDDFGVTDILGYASVGLWMLIRSIMAGEITKPQKKTANVEKLVKWTKRFKIFAPIAELIPYLGALPWWTIAVYMELKYGEK